MNQDHIQVGLHSEIGKLQAVLLHTPGPEIEAMTPENAHDALYSDILNKSIVDNEYRFFAGTLSRCTRVYQVQELLAEVLENASLAEELVRKSCAADGCDFLVDELLQLPPQELARTLIEGFPYRKGKDDPRYEAERYILKPLYNLFFTRDALSCVFDRALVNTMSFQVRVRESLIYRAIFENHFGASAFSAAQYDPEARTEGGDVQIVRPDLLCVGCGIRTNPAGIQSLMQAHRHLPRFSIIAQELPLAPESFIHLDMVFTFLGPHTCMAYEPLIRKTGIFSGKKTTLITYDNGQTSTREFPDILAALKSQGIDLEPVFCGGSDPWVQQREQWHSGANFFAFAPDHIIGYRRNTHTIEALNRAGFDVLAAEEVCAGREDPFAHKKCVVTFAASELPRGGGGARCMTCPISREAVEY